MLKKTICLIVCYTASALCTAVDAAPTSVGSKTMPLTGHFPARATREHRSKKGALVVDRPIPDATTQSAKGVQQKNGGNQDTGPNQVREVVSRSDADGDQLPSKKSEVAGKDSSTK